MAKDVDLSSHKWRELIFEGKNKEFGAYQMRKDSGRRHGLAMIIVSAALAVILTIVILIFSGVIGGDDEVDPNAGVDQALVSLAEEEEAPEEEQQEQFEEPEPEPEPEPEIEKTAEVKVTDILITDDDKVKPEDQVKETNRESDVKTGTENIQSENTIAKEERKNDITAGSPTENNDANENKPPQSAQQNTQIEKPKPPAPAKIFEVVEQKAVYPGGEQALLKWIGSNLQYPVMAQEEGVQGRVIVRFVVEVNGSIGKVEVVRGRHPELDKEAVSVVKRIPKKFTPAKQNGEAVRSWFSLPVNFKLQQ